MNTRKTLPDFDDIFNVAAEHLIAAGTRQFSVCEISQSLNVSTDMLSPVFDDIYSFAASFGRYIDGAVVKDIDAGIADDSGEPARDRLFEVLMSRFDALQPFKAAVQALAKAAPRDPKLAAVMAVRLPQSMALMLSLAGLKSNGFKHPLQVAGLVGLWLRTARVWLKDDTEDMSKTMAGLDKALKDIDGVARRLF